MVAKNLNICLIRGAESPIGYVKARDAITRIQNEYQLRLAGIPLCSRLAVNKIPLTRGFPENLLYAVFKSGITCINKHKVDSALEKLHTLGDYRLIRHFGNGFL